MSLTPTQLQELQTIVLDLGEEFPHNADALWNAAIRIQTGGLGPTSGAGGQPAFDAAVADIKACQEAVQTYQQRQGSPNSGFDVAVLQVVPATSTFPSGNVGEILYLETAPNSYIATDQIVIDPVGPNSVQMDEVGTTVFRTVPAASGGVEINNLSTGAGFERVLTTADLTVMGGQVDTVVGGVNISVNAADPINPIVNLDAAITGVSVNGVTLSNAGLATDFLNEAGNYVPVAGIADGTVEGAGLFWDQDTDLAWEERTTFVYREAVDHGNGVGNWLTISNAAATRTGIRLLVPGLEDLVIFADDTTFTTQFVTQAMQFSAPSGSNWLHTVRFAYLSNVDNMELMDHVSGKTIRTSSSGGHLLFSANNGTGGILIDAGSTLYQLAAASANANLTGWGQFWVRNTLDGEPMFTDDVGVTTVLNAVTAPAGADTQLQFNNSGAFGASANLTWDGTDLDIVGAGGLVITNGADAIAIRVATDINITAAGSPDMNITGVVAINAGTVDADFDNLTATDFNGVALTTGGAATNFLNETGAYSVPPSAGVNNPMTVDLDGDGFNIDDLGVIFMREQAASDPDVPTQGQLWVRDDSFANTLMFTTGQGNEYEVAGIPYDGDLLDGAGSLSTTTFVGWVNIGPKPNTWYTLICQGQAVAPAADDVKVQLTVDTNSVFQGLYVDSNGQQVAMRSAIGEVVTNTVVVDTDGSATDDGTFFTITGALKAGATGQTVSLRAAKNADTGANGFIYFPTMSVVRLSET